MSFHDAEFARLDAALEEFGRLRQAFRGMVSRPPEDHRRNRPVVSEEEEQSRRERVCNGGGVLERGPRPTFKGEGE